MKFTASQIAKLLEGEIEGNKKEIVLKLSKIEEGQKGSLTFLSNPKYTPFLYTTNASIIIVDEDLKLEKAITPTLIRVKNAHQAFSTLLNHYNEVKEKKSGKEKPISISKSAKIGKNCYLGAFSYIGSNVVIGQNVKIYPHTYIGDNVTIGDQTVLFSGVKVYSETVIGNKCKIHANAVIGSDGFGFIPNKEGEYNSIPQIGNVIIEDNVDIGASCTIDRATLGSTVIKKGVKLDNQLQIGHNVEINENTVIAAQAGIAGSTKIGKNCMIGGQAGIVGHVNIGDFVRIQAQSGVHKNLKNKQSVQGSPSLDYAQWNRSYVHFKQLQETIKRLQNLEKELKTLKSKESAN